LPTEKFDILVKFDDTENGELDDELVGIEEIEQALENISPVVYIKESEFIDVVLVELSTDSVEAAIKLRDAPTTVISKVVPINAVVNTGFKPILNKIHEMVDEKANPGDSFNVNSVLKDVNKIQTREIKNAVIQDLEDSQLILDNKKPNWIVQIEVLGENTGLSVLKPSQYVETLDQTKHV
jgi:tRNA acetyltransferase TAN1